MSWRVESGDCLERMRALPEASVDAIVTDPPYGIGFMGKAWDQFDADPVEASWSAKGRADDVTASDFKNGVAVSGTAFRKPNPRCGKCGRAINGRDTAKGFKVCHCEEPERIPVANRDAHRFQMAMTEWATECWRVAKPGAHLVAFGGTRTFHRLACAIEDAGWEIRDTLVWLYGSGFPKSLDVSKAMDKVAGAEREVVGRYQPPNGKAWNLANDQRGGAIGTPHGLRSEHMDVTAPATEMAKQWQGWGTALKPAHEPILLASKPLTVEQHFTIIARALTSLIFEAALCGGVSASDVEQSSSAILAKLSEEADGSVLDGARIKSLASVGLVSCAEPSSTSTAPESSEPTRTRADTALSHVRPEISEARKSEPTTPPGTADDLLTRLMAMCTSVIAGGISESTVSSWSSISADLLNAANTYTIATASKLTTALRTLNSLMLPIISGDTGSSSPSNFSPAHTPIILARKPLAGTVAQTVARFGTGALNIDATRIGTSKDVPASPRGQQDRIFGKYGAQDGSESGHNPNVGRWPANVVLAHSPECRQVGTRRAQRNAPIAGSEQGRSGLFVGVRSTTSHEETVPHWECAPGCPVALLDAQSGERKSGGGNKNTGNRDNGVTIGSGLGRGNGDGIGGDTGGASRFFYVAKASRREREAGLGGPMLRLRDDLTPEQREIVYAELAAAGVSL